MFNNETKQILKSLLLSSTILFVTFDLMPLRFVRRTIDDISHTWDAYPGIFQLLYWVAVRDRIIPPLIIATILAGLIFYFAKQKDNITQKPILFFSAINAFLISLPSSVFIGMFCKLGSLEANLPVFVAANKKDV